MKEYSAAPGASAIILEREMVTDDNNSFETHYYRIKILREDGKKWADVELPYYKGPFDINDIKARTIEPDGRIVNFNGKIFEKVVAKTHGFGFVAKTFTLPEVEVGSILEYKYRLNWDSTRLYSTKWNVQDDLFTRHAQFQIHIYPDLPINWIWSGLPGGVQPKNKNGTVSMEVSNIPALDKEDDMPPKTALQSKVEFYYSSSLIKPQDFWKNSGKEWNKAAEDFMGHHGAVKDAVEALVTPQDDLPSKLRKLYARAQQVRNLTYEDDKTKLELKNENLKENKNVDDVLKHDYGYAWQINQLFVAMVRAAGVDAKVARISERDSYFFNPRLLDDNQLDGEVAYIQIDGHDTYLDPGTPQCPFGWLSWEKTAVQGILLDKDGGKFVTSYLPIGAAPLVARRADFQLQPDGSLSGTLTVSFVGEQALLWRLWDRQDDDVTRRKDLEDEAHRILPRTAQVKLTKMDGWNQTESPLTATFDVTVPIFASHAGHMLILSPTLLHDEYPFQTSTRKYSVYLHYPRRVFEEINLKLPPGVTVETLPTAANQQKQFGIFQETYESSNDTIRVTRTIHLDGILFPTSIYADLHSFYQTVRSTDEQQAVLRIGHATH